MKIFNILSGLILLSSCAQFLNNGNEVNNNKQQIISFKQPNNEIQNRQSIIPEDRNIQHINFWEKFYAKEQGQKRLLRQIENGEKYKAIIENILEDHNIPSEIYYLGMIESGYYIRAKSSAKATGPWQFMAGTAKKFGLVINKHVDERYNIVKSTHAAAQYLKYLYGLFKDWKLAFAAYNAGEGRVLRAIKKAKSSDYETLVELKFLPPETRNYIPKYIVVKKIVEEFLAEVNDEQQWNRLDPLHSIEINKTICIENLAKNAGIKSSIIKEHNPQFLSNIIPGTKKQSFQLYLPKDLITLVSDILPATKTITIPTFKIHKVRQGDSLWMLAREYGVTVNKIMSWNNLKKKSLKIGLMLKFYS